ncbi:MAG: phosphate acyltransferase PlsX [Gammaproteobacteria bacterium]|nr:phosphate acyltransferase PlsX [Gammaproteobacteria bacterium]
MIKYATNPMITLAIDAMGGDKGPSAVLDAVRKFINTHPQVVLYVVGKHQELESFEHSRVEKVYCSEVISMDDSLEVALRKKKDSSMRVAISLVATGKAQAIISGGNTAALMALSKYQLKTLKTIHRPGIAVLMPNIKGKYTTVMDMGANVDCDADDLLQFAKMGAAYVAVNQDIQNPKVGLLNVGEESIKGNVVVRQAFDLLQEASKAGIIHFVGNVEGNDIAKGKADLIVCDGFVGNILLKAIEGYAGFFSQSLQQSFLNHGLWGKLSAYLSLPTLRNFKLKMDSRGYNGAALLGLQGLVFKSHGGSDGVAIYSALQRASHAIEQDLLRKILVKLETST